MLRNTEHISSNGLNVQPGEIMEFQKVGVFSENAVSLLSPVMIP